MSELLAFLLTLFQPAPMHFSSDVDAIRLEQRECLQQGRVFQLEQAPGGWMTRCNK